MRRVNAAAAPAVAAAAATAHESAAWGQNNTGRNRWVMYSDPKNYSASSIPREWHGWLHYIHDGTPTKARAGQNVFFALHFAPQLRTMGSAGPPGLSFNKLRSARATGFDLAL